MPRHPAETVKAMIAAISNASSVDIGGIRIVATDEGIAPAPAGFEPHPYNATAVRLAAEKRARKAARRAREVARDKSNG